MEVPSPTLLFSGFEWLTAISSIGCNVCGWDAVGSVHRLSVFPGLQIRGNVAIASGGMGDI